MSLLSGGRKDNKRSARSKSSYASFQEDESIMKAMSNTAAAQHNTFIGP